MLDKKDYIVKQLHRTHNKKFENYVITRIWHLLNDLDIKIITQQYIVRPNGFALTDLYFPQFNLIVEVDEEHHLGQKLADNIRDRDVINAADFHIKRIDTTKNIELIHAQIDELVNQINELKKKGFKKWDYEKEFDPRQYIDKGYIDIKDNAMFKKQIDSYNLFGHNYKKPVQRSSLGHKFKPNVAIWHPKLYDYGEWNNEISLDETIIYESNKNPDKNKIVLNEWLNHPRYIRYVFAHSKDNIGRTLYRFKGEFTLNRKKTIEMQKAVWERTNTRVETFSNEILNKKNDC